MVSTCLETLIDYRQKFNTLSKKAGVSVESYAEMETELKRTKLELASNQKKLSKVSDSVRIAEYSN